MVLKYIVSFINYWYFRYLLVTELYMVEKWERTMFHVLVLLFLGILYLFNSFVTLGLIKMFINWMSTESIPDDQGPLINQNYEL